MLDEEAERLAPPADQCFATDPVTAGCRDSREVLGDSLGVGVQQSDPARGLAYQRSDEIGQLLVSDVGGSQSFAVMHGEPSVTTKPLSSLRR